MITNSTHHEGGCKAIYVADTLSGSRSSGSGMAVAAVHYHPTRSAPQKILWQMFAQTESTYVHMSEDLSTPSPHPQN